MTVSSAAAIGVLERWGGFFSLCGDTFRALGRRPFQRNEFLEQVVFIAGVSIVPVVFVTIPFTIVVQFFLGQLLVEIGAVDLSGAGAGFGIIRELGPFSAVLVVTGGGATAVCADLGTRTIREEIDALRVLGIDPVHRLVVPRVLAFMVVSVGLFGVVAVVGLVGTFLFSTTALGATPGLFVANLALLTDYAAFLVSLAKAALFGLAAGLVSCYLGLTARGGPKGVGDAVNQTVVFTLMVLVVINTAASTLFLQLSEG
ncbi:MAG TPA: ABC transporter permease [Nocardioidaceae bacterium]